MSGFKYFMMMECPRQRVLQLSHENEREGLLPDCIIGVKDSKSEDDSRSRVSSMHGNLLSDESVL